MFHTSSIEVAIKLIRRVSEYQDSPIVKLSRICRFELKYNNEKQPNLTNAYKHKLLR